MTTLLYTHPLSHKHVEPPGHPERVDRIRAVDAVLAHPDFGSLVRREAPEAARADLLRAHPDEYLQTIEAATPANGHIYLDSDTWMCPDSWRAALHAAGAAVAAVDAVLDGDAHNAFCAMRPCGHHAERTRPMGFCTLANAAIAALHALDARGLSRVAIADFDVHHGNGTQDVVERDPRVLFISSHQSPLYPGTGRESETGVDGSVVNIELPSGADGAAFRAAWEARALPALTAHKPELLIISAGFDAHINDPLANLALTADDFAWITERLCDIADASAQGRVVSVLEGGYDLGGLSTSVAAHVSVLRDRGAAQGASQ